MQDSIVEMRAAVVPTPLAEPFAAGRWRLEAVYNVVVELRSASGVSGIGYAFVFRDADGQTILAAVNGLREIVLGWDPLDSTALHAGLRAATNFVGAGGAAMSAVGAIDLAIWDLKGRRLGVPVHALLGSTRTKVPAYASGGSFGKDLGALEREVRGYLDQGFTAVKIKLPPEVKEACRRITASRTWVGEGVKMLYDSNQQQTYKDALEIARCCADNGAYWYEEPFPFWQLERAADLRRSIRCRLALGETLYGETPFHDAARVGAADVLMPNLHKIGGITAWVRIAGMTGLAGVALSSHTMPEVSAHVMSATPNADLLEYLDWWRLLYEQPFAIEDGSIIIGSDEPGLGLCPSKTVRAALEIA
ncbi:MAG: mandelate racemase/muconate lactonizing enzyme family protein [Candidatus Rokubacteria bacterium]|nr:mandelate racemase/muconate lactonizing enzyme family protein [Candidatus Rokubacteria bacterium]